MYSTVKIESVHRAISFSREFRSTFIESLSKTFVTFCEFSVNCHRNFNIDSKRHVAYYGSVYISIYNVT
jgi:hypothetical protein